MHRDRSLRRAVDFTKMNSDLICRKNFVKLSWNCTLCTGQCQNFEILACGGLSRRCAVDFTKNQFRFNLSQKIRETILKYCKARNFLIQYGGKMKNLLSPKNIFRQIISFVISFVKTLLSQNFLPKMRESKFSKISHSQCSAV